MSLCEAFANYARYGIILLERAWAVVIAGARSFPTGS